MQVIIDFEADTVQEIADDLDAIKLKIISGEKSGNGFEVLCQEESS